MYIVRDEPSRTVPLSFRPVHPFGSQIREDRANTRTRKRTPHTNSGIYRSHPETSIHFCRKPKVLVMAIIGDLEGDAEDDTEYDVDYVKYDVEYGVESYVEGDVKA